jgi:hypothetical protein
VLEAVKEFKNETGIIISLEFVKRKQGDVAATFCNPQKFFKYLILEGH